MAELEGYICDNCGKVGKDVQTFAGAVLPHSWYKVFPGWNAWKVLHYCSRECLAAGADGKARVSVPLPPESVWTLFKKLLKAVFGCA